MGRFAGVYLCLVGQSSPHTFPSPGTEGATRGWYLTLWPSLCSGVRRWGLVSERDGVQISKYLYLKAEGRPGNPWGEAGVS